MRNRTVKTILTLISVLILAMSVLGCSMVSLKPGVHIKEAYHYYPDGMRCHCILVAGLMDDAPYLDAHDFRIEDCNGTTCTLVFKIGNSDELYCLYDYPLSNLDYRGI